MRDADWLVFCIWTDIYHGYLGLCHELFHVAGPQWDRSHARVAYPPHPIAAWVVFNTQLQGGDAKWHYNDKDSHHCVRPDIVCPLDLSSKHQT